MGTRIEHARVIDKNSLTTSLHSSSFSHVLCDYAGRTAQVYFSSYLKTKILKSVAHILSTFSMSFKPFSLKFDTNVAR